MTQTRDRNPLKQITTTTRNCLILFLSSILLVNVESQAATASNAYVTVSSSTYGVEDIVPVRADFYITTRNVSKSTFRADIAVKANKPYYLVKPQSGRMNLGIGESDGYRVRDESGTEDEFSGRVYVLKLDIEPTETNVCWKATSCTLKLTDDSYPGGTAEWTSSPSGISGSGNSITFSPNTLTTGVYTVTAKSEIVASYTDTCIVRVFNVEFITPNGNPVNAPVDSGDGQNEFTFSGANPGVLTMQLKAKVIPASVASAITGCQFNVGDIGSSVKNWATNNPNGKATVSGSDLTATVTFAGLPGLNSDFGKKTATVSHGGIVCDAKDYEVFFPKTATNHPGGQVGSPNWFYYWSQALGMTNVRYSSMQCNLYGECPGMLRWTYSQPSEKGVVVIYDLAAQEDPGDLCADHGMRYTSGIDTFNDTYLHENHHKEQVTRADCVVGIIPNTTWRFGWSWNVAGHNHWTVGADLKPGLALVDDDNNGLVDDLAVVGPGELGSGDDVILDDGSGQDWPRAFGNMPPQPWAGGYALEDSAYNCEHDNEGEFLAVDWSDPGKQHKTLGRFGD